MPLTLECHHLTKAYASRTVLSDVSFALRVGERLGVVGANGSGKTTLLRVLAGLEVPDVGVVRLPGGATVGYVPQAPEEELGKTVAEVVGVSHAGRGLQALRTLNLVDRKDARMDDLSAGQQTRVYLARILSAACDILLLDEPTNHLDVPAMEWLEEYLRSFPGIVCVVAHDRAFLDHVATRIGALDQGTLRLYGGDYTSYQQQREIERHAQLRTYEAQQKTVRRLQETAREERAEAERIHDDRKPKRDQDKLAASFFADRASQKRSAAAKGIERRLTEMSLLSRPHADPKLKLLFGVSSLGPGIVARLREVSFGISGKQIIGGATATIERGMRIAIHGDNGAGKSTLVRLIAGGLVPTSGEVVLGTGVQKGYLSQDHAPTEPATSVLDTLLDGTAGDATRAHQLLAWLGVPPTHARLPVSSLSQGEQRKLLLAQLIASGSNFLVLDEPTNHLDIPAREAMEAALRAYMGTLLVVSHDRYFLDAIGVKTHWEVRDGVLREL